VVAATDPAQNLDGAPVIGTFEHLLIVFSFSKSCAVPSIPCVFQPAGSAFDSNLVALFRPNSHEGRAPSRTGAPAPGSTRARASPSISSSRSETASLVKLVETDIMLRTSFVGRWACEKS